MMELQLNYYTQLLQSCHTHKGTLQGKQLHPLFLKKGIINCLLSIGNRLLQMYVRCGSMEDACKLFDEMPNRNCFTWNTMIEGHMKSGENDRSLELFNLMHEKNNFSWNVVISGLVKAGDLIRSRVLFEQMPRRNGVIWNTMIHGYARRGYPKEALRIFMDLNSDPVEKSGRDSHVLASVLSACSDLTSINCGKQIHARIIMDNVEFDSVLVSSLVNLYGKCGDLGYANRVLSTISEPDDFSLSALIAGYANKGKMEDARRIFSKRIAPCIIVWNSLIAGFVSNNEDMEAVGLFKTMRRSGVREDFSTLSSLLSACAHAGLLEIGKQLHCHAYKVGVSVDVIFASSLIDMYSKCECLSDACKFFGELGLHDTILLNSMINIYSNCGRVQEAKHIFESIQCKSLISWNSLLAGLSQNGYPLTALDVFYEMNKFAVPMDQFSLASVISASASISFLEFGEQAFAKAILISLEADPVVSTALIDLYCKCGFVDLGQRIFNGMRKLDVVSWNSMLVGYATNGCGNETLNLFYEFLLAGYPPNKVTLMAVLSACDHCRLVEEARKWFISMQYYYHINPGYEHYSCMINLFSRAGLLEEAIQLIEEMPFKADTSVWSSVLRGCVAHGDKILCRKVAKMVIELDPGNSDAYVQLSGVLAAAGDWEESKHVRDMMRENCKEKNPGFSWGSN